MRGEEAATDQQEKLRIRKRARRRFEWSVVAMLLLAALGVWDTFWFGEVQKYASESDLSSSERALLFETIRYEMEQGKQLAVHTLPAIPAERRLWAARIERHFGHPAAVFVQSGHAVEWVQNPLSPAATAEVERLVGRSADSAVFRPIKDFGVRTVSTCNLKSEPDRVWQVSDSATGARWGVVVNEDDEWLAFFGQLKTPRGEPLEFGGPAWMLLEEFALPASVSRAWLPGFRAYLNDSLVFETADLDTTQFSYEPKPVSGHRTIYYAAKRSSLKNIQRMERARSWWEVILPLVLIVPLYRSYRAVRKLTAPNT